MALLFHPRHLGRDRLETRGFQRFIQLRQIVLFDRFQTVRQLVERGGEFPEDRVHRIGRA